MISKSLLLTFFFLITSSAWAGPSEQSELDDIAVRQEQLNLKRDWVKYRLEKSQHDCYDNFFTSRCLEKARLLYRQEIKEIRAQEVPMHERERALKAILKDERDAQRISERDDAAKAEKRADNVKAFEQKKQDESKRQADLEKRRLDSETRAKENKKATPF
jgi:endo-1,4-beta-D-glucanase Y